MTTISDLSHAIKRACSPMLLVTTAAIAFTTTDIGQAQADGVRGWTEHYDARLHVGINLPAGWTMKTEGYTLIAQSPDHASLVLAEAFVNASGETAQSHIAKLSVAHAALFPKAHIDRIAPQPSQGDTQIGALSYQSAQGGTGQARVLCSIFQQSGMLYAFSAPNAHFEQERPALMQMLQSLRFGPPPGGATNTSGAAKGTATGTGAGSKSGKGGTMTGANSVEFVKWTDPKEGAFTVDVPKGWKIEGGMYRFVSSDTRCSFRLTSPDNEMLIQIGDQSIPQYLIVPTQAAMRTYPVPIGVPFTPNNTVQNMLMPYMTAPEFNKWYMSKALSQGLSDLAITQEQQVPEAARQQAEEGARISGGTSNISCSVATTEFKGRNKATGQGVVGVVTSITSLSIYKKNPNMPNWHSEVTVLGCNVDAKTEVHQQILKTVLARIERTLEIDAQWQHRLNVQMARETGMVLHEGQIGIEKTGELSKQIAANAEANRKRIMGSYWNHVNAQSEQQRHFVNYVGDQTDVVDTATGETHKVASGYSNYYHDPRTGVILGTNSTDRPPVDFNPMKEF